MTSDYWVEISREGASCGAGFLLTRRFALTAAHCLHNRAGEEDVVTISRSNGDSVSGRVIQIDIRRDVALIEVIGSLGWTLLTPSVDRGEKGDSWFSPYRPRQDVSELQGWVLTSPIQFLCAGGEIIEALELQVRQLVGAYTGYSGSPVERQPDDADDAADRVVIGILLEQNPHQVRPAEATNVLFAATIAQAMSAFDVFQPPRQYQRLHAADSHQHTHAAATGEPPRDAATAPPPAAQARPRFFEGARAAIEEIQALVDDGYLPHAAAAEHIRDVVRNASDRMVSWSGHEHDR